MEATRTATGGKLMCVGGRSQGVLDTHQRLLGGLLPIANAIGLLHLQYAE